jgi:hypothetical protein
LHEPLFEADSTPRLAALALPACRADFFLGAARDSSGALELPRQERHRAFDARHVDDNSRLNPTEVAEVWPIPSDVAQAERDIVSLIARARRDKLPISIAGARHSMGGHTIAPGGIMLDMLPFHQMQLDATTIPTSFFRTSFI